MDEYIRLLHENNDAAYALFSDRFKAWDIACPQKPAVQLYYRRPTARYIDFGWWNTSGLIRINMVTMMIGKGWETHKHEMAHHFQMYLMPKAKGHGELFKLLMQVTSTDYPTKINVDAVLSTAWPRMRQMVLYDSRRTQAAG